MSDESKPKSESAFRCVTCGTDETAGMSFEDMKRHIVEVHQIDPKTEMFSKDMIAHMDGKDYYMSVFRLVANGVELTQTVRNERDKNDPMRR